ncbi:glycosyltransferase family 2 protein [Ideonella alba]|uniref:Glycosyltransferase n=1 Tax=Ideonella alba TaxID=2824118 RepID=A0A940YBB4_9BURK|nr:glycosyltransferase [Ideonella alba]
MFSIVTPSYNQGVFIRKCIDSVAQQSSHVELEHLIFDNESSDTTQQILLECSADIRYSHLKISIERDRGQTHAINKGFRSAQGDILCWLNTDEFYHERSLALVQRFFAEHPEVDVVFGDVEFVDASSATLRFKSESDYSWHMLLYYGCFIPSCSTFVRRTALMRSGFLDERLKVVMDFEWYLRLAQSGAKFAPLKEVLASFTWHETNISSTFEAKRKAERLEVQLRYSRLPLPDSIRPIVFSLLKYYWMGVRSFRRWNVRRDR